MKKLFILGAMIGSALLLVVPLLFTQNLSQLPNNESVGEISSEDLPQEAIVVVSEDLVVPWDVAFMLNDDVLISERTGTLLRQKKDGERTVIHDEDVVARGEGGLLGIALHPEFTSNNYVYLYFSANRPEGGTENRVERYTLVDDSLKNKTTIIDAIPGAAFHDGGRIAFGPDGYLYIATGDAGKPDIAQDTQSLGGKILRLEDDGSIPPDNPFNNEVYSYGHRNPQGLTWDDEGRLWSTEHGRSGVQSGLDELNLIVKGGNYGWPDSQGDTVLPGTIGPVLHSGASFTWAPASAAYIHGSIFFGGLRGEGLYEAVLEGEEVKELNVYFFKEFGRVRTVTVGPDRMLYMTTSNRDGRGNVRDGDDKIIRIDPSQL